MRNTALIHNRDCFKSPMRMFTHTKTLLRRREILRSQIIQEQEWRQLLPHAGSRNHVTHRKSIPDHMHRSRWIDAEHFLDGPNTYRHGALHFLITPSPVWL